MILSTSEIIFAILGAIIMKFLDYLYDEGDIPIGGGHFFLILCLIGFFIILVR